MSKPLPADKYDPDTLMSYQEWKDAGFFILKGSKSRCRDASGVCQFSKDQTTAADISTAEFEACDATEADIY